MKNVKNIGKFNLLLLGIQIYRMSCFQDLLFVPQCLKKYFIASIKYRLAPSL